MPIHSDVLSPKSRNADRGASKVPARVKPRLDPPAPSSDTRFGLIKKGLGSNVPQEC
jgi:hypothetical protein